MKSFRQLTTAQICQLIFAGLLFLAPGIYASATFEPVFDPTLSVAKTNQTIDIDGDLSDPGWKLASRISNFVERTPGDNSQPAVETEAYITYDQDKLYVAFICHDDPSAIRATMCQRDQFSGDDAVMLLLDTYGDAAWAYEFYVNPYGIQKDYLWTSVAGEDIGYDLIWESAAKITSSGYQVEMAIPFASMRFPNKDVQTWKMDFWRNHPRASANQYSWAAHDRNDQCWVCQWGTVDGIRNVRPGKGFEIMPAFVGNQSGYYDTSNETPSFENSSIDGEFSIGGKYSISSDVTAEGSFNPDFSQIEADAAQVDVNTTIALFYPERRPFFQEGADIFRTLFNSFYTRTVNDPQYAVKLTGRVNRTSVGFLSALDENTPYMIPLDERSEMVNSGKSYVNVLRASRSFGESSRIGFLASDRRLDGGGSGSVFTVDGDIKLSKNYRIDGQYIVTHTGEPDNLSLTEGLEGDSLDDGTKTAVFDGESYYGYGMIARFIRSARNLNFTLNYNQVSPTYRTEIGYDPWINYRDFSIFTGYNIYPQNSIFTRLTPQIYTATRWRSDGIQRNQRVNLALSGRLSLAQSYFTASYSNRSERWDDKRYEDLWGLHFDCGGYLSDRFGYDFDIEYGPTVARRLETTGNQISIDASLDLKPFDRLMLEPSVSYVRSNEENTGTELYEVYITRTRCRFQVNKELSLRLVVQYDDYYKAWDVDPLFTYRLNPFSVLYVGSTYDYSDFGSPEQSQWKLSSRQFFMKLQYLFQI